MSHPGPIIELHHISKQFPGVKALDNVHFEMNAGEVHALLGEKGAEIIYPNPGFPIYESVIRWTGAKPVALPLLEKTASPSAPRTCCRGSPRAPG